MTMTGNWVTNTHRVRVSVHDWDDKRCLVTPEVVAQCFFEPCTHDHVILIRDHELRLVDRDRVEDDHGGPLIKRVSISA